MAELMKKPPLSAPTYQGLRCLAATIGRTLVATAAPCFTSGRNESDGAMGDGNCLGGLSRKGLWLSVKNAWARGVETSDANLDHA